MVMLFQQCCQGCLERKVKVWTFHTGFFYLYHEGKSWTQAIISFSFLSCVPCCFIRHGHTLASQYISVVNNNFHKNDSIDTYCCVVTKRNGNIDVISCSLPVGDGLVQPEALNKKAIQIINRVRDKLTGEFHLFSVPQERECHCWSALHFRPWS